MHFPGTQLYTYRWSVLQEKHSWIHPNSPTFQYQYKIRIIQVLACPIALGIIICHKAVNIRSPMTSNNPQWILYPKMTENCILSSVWQHLEMIAANRLSHSLILSLENCQRATEMQWEFDKEDISYSIITVFVNMYFRLEHIDNTCRHYRPTRSVKTCI